MGKLTQNLLNIYTKRYISMWYIKDNHILNHISDYNEKVLPNLFWSIAIVKPTKLLQKLRLGH